VVDDGHGRQFATLHNAHFFKVSAVTGFGVSGLFDCVARGMLTNPAIQTAVSEPTLNTDDTRPCAC
jgi:hypothetical protein